VNLEPNREPRTRTRNGEPGTENGSGSDRPVLLRILGIGFGVAVTIGTTIGAGIFRAPGEVAAQLPTPTLFLAAWAIGGLYALLGAIQIAELGAMLPRSGGQYVFARHALGEYAGFLVGWSDWLSTCGTTAAVAIVIGEFTGAVWPAFAALTLPVAAGVTCVFTLLQWRGIREGSAAQAVTSLLKAAAFIVLIAAAFLLGGDTVSAPAVAAPGGIALAVAFVIALQSVIYTYDGWTGVVYFSEEVRDPGRDIPRSLLGSVLLIIALYLLVNAAFLYALPVSEIGRQDFAAGAVARALLGDRGDVALRIVTIVALLSAVNANQLMASRVVFAMARDGVVSTRVARVNAGGTPDAALFLSTAVALLFILLGRTFEQVITVLAFFFIANYTLSFVSLLVLRRREPLRERPYRAWGYPWTTMAVLLGSVAFLAGAVAGDTRNSLYALVLLLASVPAYRGLRRLR
jgi:basic amino acid/polyamine antiporter, APA family